MVERATRVQALRGVAGGSEKRWRHSRKIQYVILLNSIASILLGIAYVIAALANAIPTELVGHGSRLMLFIRLALFLCLLAMVIMYKHSSKLLQDSPPRYYSGIQPKMKMVAAFAILIMLNAVMKMALHESAAWLQSFLDWSMLALVWLVVLYVIPYGFGLFQAARDYRPIRWQPVFLAAFAAIALLAMVLFYLHPIPSEKKLNELGVHKGAERLKAQNDVLTTLLQGLGGFAVIYGAFFAFRQFQTAREGQVTERFTRAIEQLGNNRELSVRMGGIFALERIARDSSRDQGAIEEVLTAFVRDHSPWPPRQTKRSPAEAKASEPILWLSKGNRANEMNDESKPQARADVQAAMTVLGRRRLFLAVPELNLASVDLRTYQLWYTHLEGAWLWHANLDGARLRRAHLQEAKLEGADLRGADLEEADLEKARLGGARFNSETVWPDGFDWKAATGAEPEQPPESPPSTT
jgi:hypothetical protein